MWHKASMSCIQLTRITNHIDIKVLLNMICVSFSDLHVQYESLYRNVEIAVPGFPMACMEILVISGFFYHLIWQELWYTDMPRHDFNDNYGFYVTYPIKRITNITKMSCPQPVLIWKRLDMERFYVCWIYFSKWYMVQESVGLRYM